jgi:hypothetical protein
MKGVSQRISEILATVTDILQPQDFEQLKIYGFTDSPTPRRDDSGSYVAKRPGFEASLIPADKRPRHE